MQIMGQNLMQFNTPTNGLWDYVAVMGTPLITGVKADYQSYPYQFRYQSEPDSYRILISGGNGKLARFNQVFWTKLLPVWIDYYRTDCLFRAPFGLSSLWGVVGSLLSLSGRSRLSNWSCQIVSDRQITDAQKIAVSGKNRPNSDS